MGDEDTKEENKPSTSKDSPETEPLDDNVRQDDRETNSKTSSSHSYYGSRVDIIDARSEIPKPTMDKREPKNQRKKRPTKPYGGRVVKRKRSIHRRRMKPRVPRRRIRMRKAITSYDRSLTTINTRLSSTGSISQNEYLRCRHCGCRRRYVGKKTRKRPRRRRKKMCNVGRRVKKRPKISATMQAGSRCKMFSPLYIKTKDEAGPKEVEESNCYSEVSPQMIYQSLRQLSVWKQNIETDILMSHMQRNYPVNPVADQLYTELIEKLRIAVIAGIVTETFTDCWSLNGALLHNKELSPNHVTLFWKAYTDTLSPFNRAKPEEPAPDVESTGNTMQII